MSSSSNATGVVDEEYWTIPRVAFAFAMAFIPMVISGVVGNALIIKIMPNRGPGMSSTGVLFSILAVIDTYVICLGPFRLILNEMFAYSDLDTVVKRMFFEWGILCGLTLSTWSLVIITAERLFCVLFPLQFKKVFTVRRVVIMEIIALLSLAVFHAVRAFGITHQIFDEVLQIFVIKSRIKDGLKISNWSDFILMYAAPFLFICIGSIIISTKIRSLKRGESAQHSSRIVSITRNLIGANITFIVTNTPFRIMNFFFGAGCAKNLTGVQVMTIIYVCMYFQYLGQAMNFYVYVLSGQTFRQDTKNLLCRNIFKNTLGRTATTTPKTTDTK